MTERDRVVCLSIDAAARSGWAIHRGLELIASGTARSPRTIREAVQRVQDELDTQPSDLVVCGEDIYPTHRTHTAHRLGVAWGRWMQAIDVLGVSEQAVLRFRPSTWRSGLRISRGRRSDLKTRARAMVRAIYGLDLACDDEAEAILIGRFGMLARRESLLEARPMRSGSKDDKPAHATRPRVKKPKRHKETVAYGAGPRKKRGRPSAAEAGYARKYTRSCRKPNESDRSVAVGPVV